MQDQQTIPEEQTQKEPLSSAEVEKSATTAATQIIQMPEGVISGGQEPMTGVRGSYFTSKYRIRAVLCIGIPALLFWLGANSRGLVWLLIALCSPLLFISMVYGLILLFKREKSGLGLNDPMAVPARKSYKPYVIALIIGLVIGVVLPALIFWQLQAGGNVGSEAGIAAYPFMISGFLIIFVSLFALVGVFVYNRTHKEQ